MIPIAVVQKAAWSFNRENPNLEWDDLFQEACLASLEAQEKYDSSKDTKPTTWAWHYMMGRMKSFRDKQSSSSTVSLDNVMVLLEQGGTELDLQVPSAKGAEEYSQFSSAETEPFTVPFTFPLSETLEGLSKEAKQICKIILSSPQEYAGLFSKEVRGALYRTLRKDGWTWNKIWDAFRELKTHFAS